PAFHESRRRSQSAARSARSRMQEAKPRASQLEPEIRAVVCAWKADASAQAFHGSAAQERQSRSGLDQGAQGGSLRGRQFRAPRMLDDLAKRPVEIQEQEELLAARGSFQYPSYR